MRPLFILIQCQISIVETLHATSLSQYKNVNKLVMGQNIPLEIIELETGTYHPLIKANFNGLENYWWVIDTGASKSVFDKNLADHYELDNTSVKPATGIGKESLEISLGIIMECILGEKNIGPVKVALVDFSHINEEYAKFTDKKIAGLIGADFLVKHQSIINFKKKKLILLNP